MKKLIPMIAAVTCALGAYAAQTEASSADSFTSADGEFTSAWWTNTADNAVIENNTLKINADSSDAVGRFILADTGDIGTHGVREIPNTGLYFDSKVKFTISDTNEVADIDGAKIAIFAYSEEGSGVTNLLAKAGYYDDNGVLGSKTYTLDATIDASEWYRLTVKAIKIADDKWGFVTYLDETAIAYKEDGVGKIGTLSAIAAKYNTEKKLLPSMIATGDAKNTLEKVSFVGTGWLDDVDFTSTVPAFAKDAFTIAITKTAGVTGVKVNGTDLDFKDGDTATVELDPSTTTIAITAEKDDTYAWDDWVNNDAYPVEQGMQAIQVKAYEIAFTVDGTPYKTLEAAIEAAKSGKTLALAQNIKEAIALNDGEMILDLAGHDITETSADYTIYSAGTLTITNSAPELGGTVHASDGYSAYNEGSMFIYGGTFAGAIEGDKPTCYGGKFAGTEGEFPYTVGDSENFEPKFEEGYWTIVEKKVVKTTPFAIIIAGATETKTNYYDTLALAVEAAEGGTVTLMANVLDGDGVTINADVTIDLNGFTYAAKQCPAGSTGTKNQVFQLLTGKTIVFKNGTIAAAADQTAVTRLVQSYANVTFQNVTFDATNLAPNTKTGNEKAAVEFANGTVVLDGVTATANANATTAISIDNWVSYAGVTVTVKGESNIANMYVWSEGVVPATQFATVALEAGTIAEIILDANDAARTITNTGATVTTIPEGYVWNNGALVKKAADPIVVPSGETVEDVVTNATSASEIVVLDETQITIDNTEHTVQIGNQAPIKVADYYKVSIVGEEGAQTLKFELNENAKAEPATVEDAEGKEIPAVAVAEDEVGVGVATKVGLWYALETKASLDAEKWTIVEGSWVQGDGKGKALAAEAAGAQGFYRVVVSDIAPTNK